jgi:hypothetical protein
MKYVFLLITVAAVYFFLMKQTPVKPVVSVVTQEEVAPLTSGPRGGATPEPGAPAAHSDPLKRPIDRTREVLSLVKKRNGDGEF